MKKVLILVLFVLVAVLAKSPPAKAFTLIEMCGICCMPDFILVSSVGPAQAAAIKECCKCHEVCLPAPSSSSGGPSFTANPDFNNCVKKRETCPPPPPPDCGKLYPVTSPEYACCKKGFDALADAKKFACCTQHLKAVPPEDTGTPTNPKPCEPPPPDCPICPNCPPPDRCPTHDRCPPPTPLDCSIFLDKKTRECCEGFKEVPALAIGMCVKPGECNNVINITAGPGATVDLSNFNQCCQIVTNPGTMTGTSISQVCNNIIPPGGGTPGTGTTTGTEPSGSTTAASCECTPADPKAQQGDETVSMVALGKPTPFTCQYTAPATDGPLALTSASKLFVQADGPFTTMDPASAPAGSDLKTASLPTTSNTFTVWAPLLQSWQDNPDYRGMVKASALAVDGTPLSSADCPVVAKLGVQGGGSVTSGGCSLRRNP